MVIGPRRIVVPVVLTLAALASAAASASASSAPPTQPNVVVVVLDDASETQTLTRFPKTRQRFTALGVNILTFPNAYASTPVCAASRASLLTGKYAHEHGVEFNDSVASIPVVGGAPAFVESGSDQDTIATRLRADGYDTALVGKYMNNYSAISPPEGPPGWNFVRALHDQGNGYTGYSIATQTGSTQRYGHTEADYSTDVFKQRALVALAGAGAVPFLLWLAPATPHEPAIPAPRHANLFPLQIAPRPPNYAKEADKIGKPDWVQGLDWTQDEMKADDLFWREQCRAFVSADEMIVAVIDAIEAKGELDSTLFIILSDNGYSHGEHFWKGKGYPYQPAVRTPFVIAARPLLIPASGERLQLVGNIDIAPTIADLAGISSRGMTGVSFAPLLESDGAWPREDLLIARRSLNPSGEGSPFNPIPSWRGLVARRDDRMWKYVEIPVGVVNRELYDLTGDPYEFVNLAADPAHAALVSEFETRLGELTGE